MKEVLNGRYSVDELGNVYSLRNNVGNRRSTPQLLKQVKSMAGYYYVNVYEETDGGITKHTRYVHRLVAEGFIPNPMSKSQVNHIDGNKGNNVLSNLEWVTPSENVHHAFKTGLRNRDAKPYQEKFNQDHPRSRPVVMLTMQGKVVKTFPSMQEAKRQGYSQPNISSVISGKRKSHKGHLWAFA